MTAADRVREIEQPGWNAGYLAGEQERNTLAAANDELRSGLIEAKREAATWRTLATHLREQLDKALDHD